MLARNAGPMEQSEILISSKLAFLKINGIPGEKDFGDTEEIELEHHTFLDSYIYFKSNKLGNFLAISCH